MGRRRTSSGEAQANRLVCCSRHTRRWNLCRPNLTGPDVYETDGRLAGETQDLAATRILIICDQFLAQGKLAM